jgi:plastocyanin domain-containing protein
MRYWFVSLFFPLVAGLIFTGCAPEFTDDKCETSRDCFLNEICVQGRCQIAPDETDGGMNDMGPTIRTILVAPETVEVGVGRTASLEASVINSRGEVVTPESDVTWSVENGDLASVASTSDSGTVAEIEGLMAGDTTVTASLGDVSAQVSLSVATVPVARVELDTQTVFLTVGATQTLDATAYDAQGNELQDRDFDWSSGQSAIASVDDQGVVTGSGAGTTEITVSSEGRSATAAVVVDQSSVSGVTIEPTMPVSVFIGESTQLNAVPRDNMGDPLCNESEYTETSTPCGRPSNWISGSSSILTVDDTGTVTGQAVGEATVLVEVDGFRATAEVTVEQPNRPPTAEAGPDQTVEAGTQVTLDGSGSSDPDGDMLSYSWSLSGPSGSTATLSDPGVVAPTFTPQTTGTFTATLAIDDGSGMTAMDTVEITVNPDVNQSPTASIASVSSPAATGTQLNLDGSSSNDPDGSNANLSYTWSIVTQPTGSTASLGSTSGPSSTITPDVEGAYEVELSVDDGMDTDTTSVIFYATGSPSGNTAPTVQPLSDSTVVLPSGGSDTVSLSASASDPDMGQTLSYQWSITAKPSGLSSSDQPSLSNATSANATLTVNATGDYIVTVSVSDGVETALASKRVEVNANQPPSPSISVSPSSSVATGTQVTVDGSGSTDPEGGTITYTWSLTSTPSGSSATLSSTSSAQSNFTPDVAGSYTVELTASDPNNATASTTVTIQANNQAPTASATISPSNSEPTGTQLTLDASGSTDPEGGSLMYSWTVTAAPSGSSATPMNASSASATFTPDAVGSYTFEVTVTDPEGATDSTTISFTATNQAPTASATISPSNSEPTGTQLTLDASGSSDPEGGTLSYSWSVTAAPSGSSATLMNATSASATFTPDAVGSYTFEVTVTDPEGATDSTTISFTATNQAPTASASISPSNSEPTGTQLTLDASGSSDPEGGSLMYNWTVTAAPSGSSATLMNATSASATFTPDAVGSYTFEVTVTDPEGATDSTTISFTATNQAPTASASISPSNSEPTGTQLTLDASGSSDPEGGSLTYSWAVTAAPSGSSATLSSPSMGSTNFTPDVSGSYTFEVTVTDPEGATDSTTISFTAN